MKKIRLPFFTLVILLVSAVQAQAQATLYSFMISDPVITVDSDIEQADLWYKWTYQVTVVTPDAGESDPTHNALSHLTSGLENCWLGIQDEVIRNLVTDSIGFDGDNPDGSGDQRSFNIEFANFNNSTDPDGIKWNVADGSDDLDEIGEFDFFWFSVPTNEITMTTGLLKYGSNDKEVSVETPACPGCDNHTPEPLSLSLMGIGLLGMLMRRKVI